MKICFIGAGALGSTIGGVLTEGGNDIWLVDSYQAHVDAMNAGGLRMLDGPQAYASGARRLCRKPRRGGDTAAYARYFNPFNGRPGGSFTPDMLIAWTDTTKSDRPELTLKPLSAAIGLPIDTHFANHEEKALAEALRSTAQARAAERWVAGQR